MKILLTASLITLFALNSSHAQWVTGINMYNQNTGNVGINTTSPLAKFSVNGTTILA